MSPALSERLRSIGCPGEHVGANSHHITMLYLGKGVPLHTLGGAIEIAAPIMDRTPPFEVVVREVSYFPENPDDKPGHPIIAKVLSPALMKLRAQLARAFDAGGVPFSKKFPDYQPHITLSYSPTPYEITLDEPIVGTVDSTTLWGGDSQDDLLQVRFKLSDDPPKLGVVESLEAEVRDLLTS